MVIEWSRQARNEVRELIYQAYRIICRLLPDRGFIVTIFHGSRDLATDGVKPRDAGLEGYPEAWGTGSHNTHAMELSRHLAKIIGAWNAP